MQRFVKVVSFLAALVGLVYTAIQMGRLPHAGSAVSDTVYALGILSSILLLAGVVAVVVVFPMSLWYWINRRVVVWGVVVFVAALGGLVGREVRPGRALAVVAGLGCAYAIETWWRRRAVRRECPDCSETVRTSASVCAHCGYRFNVPVSAAGLMGQPEKDRVLGVAPYALMQHRTLVDALNKAGKSRLAETVAACVGADELRVVHEMLKTNNEDLVAKAVDGLIAIYDRFGVERTPLHKDAMDQVEYARRELLALKARARSDRRYQRLDRALDRGQRACERAQRAPAWIRALPKLVWEQAHPKPTPSLRPEATAALAHEAPAASGTLEAAAPTLAPAGAGLAPPGESKETFAPGVEQPAERPASSPLAAG